MYWCCFWFTYQMKCCIKSVAFRPPLFTKTKYISMLQQRDITLFLYGPHYNISSNTSLDNGFCSLLTALARRVCKKHVLSVNLFVTTLSSESRDLWLFARWVIITAHQNWQSSRKSRPRVGVTRSVWPWSTIEGNFSSLSSLWSIKATHNTTFVGPPPLLHHITTLSSNASLDSRFWSRYHRLCYLCYLYYAISAFSVVICASIVRFYFFGKKHHLCGPSKPDITQHLYSTTLQHYHQTLR